MCTCVYYNSKDHYFGRNLDLEYSYSESVIITPRYYPFSFGGSSENNKHYSMIGIGIIENDYPLYYDATNEFGLSAAGLNFPGNAIYKELDNTIAIASFELIPWLLSNCKNIPEVKALLERTSLSNKPFNEAYPPSPLHWMIADKNSCAVIEPLYEGIEFHENPIGVLTNNPPFKFHEDNLNLYMNLTSEEPRCNISSQITLMPYSRGLGAFGLPGDLSSPSRFVRAAFVKLNSVDDGSENSAVNQFFHILGSVEQQQGCVVVGAEYEKTIYTSCCNMDKLIYYYKTYNNSQIHALQLKDRNASGKKLIKYPLAWETNISFDN